MCKILIAVISGRSLSTVEDLVLKTNGTNWKFLWSNKRHWKLSRFFNVLIHRLAATLADAGTEVNFAWSLPADCNWGAIQLIIAACKTLTLSVSLLRADSFTAMYYNQKIFHCKEAERLTYTFLALPAWPSSWICYSSQSPHSIDQQVLERRTSQNRPRVGKGVCSRARIFSLRWLSFGWPGANI